VATCNNLELFFPISENGVLPPMWQLASPQSYLVHDFADAGARPDYLNGCCCCCCYCCCCTFFRVGAWHQRHCHLARDMCAMVFPAAVSAKKLQKRHLHFSLPVPYALGLKEGRTCRKDGQSCCQRMLLLAAAAGCCCRCRCCCCCCFCSKPRASNDIALGIMQPTDS